ncbi:hypothetical protein F5148DRAFT_146104 [Russula earlei]|uniref:Uncharacterized protein n=1 Tax=Russula earlei TaxID=71964 RepID=A0ACC0U6F5_9AGAM|nr:hypothetical protein F5148DRAFT_146104 [Russula earlei]
MPSANNHDPEKGKAIDGQLPNSEFNFGDSSGPFFTIYSKTVEEEDNKTVERWQKEAEGMIIFNGLFSAVVAALVVVSLQDLRPNSQDRAAFYLEKMYELQLDTNGSRPSTPSVSQPPDFSPPSYAVWVNSLWFSSLVISLTCAMLATSLQQWARRYIRLTQPARFPPHKRARVRAYFANGVDKFRVPWVADALPALVHLSLFIFVGLVIYLASINRSVFIAVFCCVAALLGVYGCITLTPFFWHDSPYCSPLSSPARLLCTEIVYAVLLVLYVFTIPFGRGTRCG